MIAVMSATGTTGSALLKNLIERGIPCRALTRSPDKLRAELGPGAPAEIIGADAADPQSLRTAFEGAEQMFLAMANQPRQVELELNAVDAAAAAGIRHVVKLSAPAAEPFSPVAISQGHFTVEARLSASKLEHTILRPYAFMQKLLLQAPAVAAQAVLIASLGDARCNYIDARDIADVATAALTRPETAGRAYDLTGGRAYTQPELADLLTSITGRRVRAVDLSPAEFHSHLMYTAHMPEWLANHIVEIQQLALARPESPNAVFEDVLGRAPRTLQAFLEENVNLFR